METLCQQKVQENIEKRQEHNPLAEASEKGQTSREGKTDDGYAETSRHDNDRSGFKQ